MAVTRAFGKLNTMQKELIIGSIDYLLEFPEKPAELITMVNHLIASLADPMLNTTPDDIKQLTQVIKLPQESFYRIEQQNADSISIASVKRFVIHLVTESIHKAQLAANTKTTWDEDLILKTYVNESDETKAIVSSNKRLNEPSTIWESRANNPSKVYSFNIEFDETHLIVKSTFNIKLSDSRQRSHTVIYENIPREYFLDEDCIYLIAGNLEAKCIKWAINEIEKFLIQENIIYDCFLPSAYSKHWPEIITDKFYLSQILAKKIRSYQLTSVEKAEEFESLMNGGVKELLKHGIIRFTRAQFLTRDEVNLISHPNYLPLLLRKEFNIDDVSLQRCRLLTTPCLAQLIASKKITLEHAFHLPTYLRPIFTMHSYAIYFSTKPIDWEQWINTKKDVAACLIDANIEKLIISNTLSIDDLNQLKPTQLAALKTDTIAARLLSQQLSFELFKGASYRRLNEWTGNSSVFEIGFFTQRTTETEKMMHHHKL